jgi:RNA polymerase sigma-70 factor (ECF subfamily)
LEDNQQNLQLLLDACQKGKRSAQKKVYYLFYGYTYSIGLRYGENRAEAEEIVNESFLKVFTKLDQYDRKYPFKQWLRKIVVNTAIDYHRKYKKLKLYTSDEPPILAGEDNEGWNNLLYEDVLREVQKLSPAYRLVFNLHVIEGLKHHEIAERLNINVGTSKSNYSKARKILQTALKQKPLAKNYRDVR